ncbi:hypothetical protein [Streptomyces virginiae]|uniref:hypothetical protein n=1 Tax=Streptomyces virginiae TaxID=1961 RepID=UPI002255ABCC|nr:hypothetical protein [Streptomyces virginiae]MCX4963136.1 hypothetical protein [Streptomyces virginiae]MCX5178929.1 hypothetical protein [Streptomyces virginiae]
MTRISAADAELKKSLAMEGDAGTKIWRVSIQPNADLAAHFLNINPPQGPGEATIAPRPDGQFDVFYLS